MLKLLPQALREAHPIPFEATESTRCLNMNGGYARKVFFLCMAFCHLVDLLITSSDLICNMPVQPFDNAFLTIYANCEARHHYFPVCEPSPSAVYEPSLAP